MVRCSGDPLRRASGSGISEWQAEDEGWRGVGVEKGGGAASAGELHGWRPGAGRESPGGARAGVRGGEWGADPGLQAPLARWLTLGRAAEQAWEPRAFSGRPHLSEPHRAAARRVSAGRGPRVAAWVRRARRVPKPDKGLGARRVGWLRVAVGREGHRRPGPGLRTGSRLGRELGRVLRDTRAVGHLY